MAREALRRGATSPSPHSSPTPSAVAAFAVRKDTSSPFMPSAPFRDVASPMSASHASLSTNPVLATLSPRPTSPTAYRIDSAALHTAPARGATYQQSSDARGTKSSTSTSNDTRSTTAVPSTGSLGTDKAAERAFYRRILFQDLLPSTHAPAITHDADLDHEVYLLLAYLLRETVLPWYSKLTPDREFLTQITSIITSIIHTVVERQTNGDADRSNPLPASDSDIHASRSASDPDLPRIQHLLSRDVPLILRQHCSGFRQAQSKVESVWAPLGPQPSSSIAPSTVSQAEQDERRRQQVHEQLAQHYRQGLDSWPGAASSVSPLQLAQQYNAACPHPGLDATTGSLDGKIELAYLRIAVHNLLSSLLPADEFAPDTEKFIVRDVLVTVLRGALARSFRPWFFVQSIHKVLDATGWASDAAVPSVSSPNNDAGKHPMLAAHHVPSAGDDALSRFLNLLTRLPAMLLKVWSFIALTAVPFLVRAYLDLFNVQRARKRRMHQAQPLQSKQDDVTNHKRSSSLRSGFPSSLSTGSLVERKMHGRYPSRKFHLSSEGTITAQGLSSAMDSNFSQLQHTDLTADALEDTAKTVSLGSLDEADLPPDYVGNWLDAAEEVFSTGSHAVLRAIFGLARTILTTTGLAESINRMTMRRINTELRDTQKLSRAVRELRRILLPNGHLPPSVPDPDVDTQEAEWIRLRMRLVSASTRSTGDESLLPWLTRQMLLGSAGGGLRRGDAEARKRDTEIQLQRLTTWLEPFCSPQAAGPNTLLAILLFERVVVAICPDLTLE